MTFEDSYVPSIWTYLLGVVPCSSRFTSTTSIFLDPPSTNKVRQRDLSFPQTKPVSMLQNAESTCLVLKLKPWREGKLKGGSVEAFLWVVVKHDDVMLINGAYLGLIIMSKVFCKRKKKSNMCLVFHWSKNSITMTCWTFNVSKGSGGALCQLDVN